MRIVNWDLDLAIVREESILSFISQYRWKKKFTIISFNLMDLFLVLIDDNITAYTIANKSSHRAQTFASKGWKKPSEKEKVGKYDNRKLMTRYLSRSCGHWLPRQMLPDWKLPYIGQEMVTTGLPMFVIETVLYINNYVFQKRKRNQTNNVPLILR